MANEFIIKNGFRSQGNSEVTGSANISGSLSVISSAGVDVFNTSTSLLKDATNKSSLDWTGRIMYDAAGVIGINYRNRSLTDTAASQSINWDSRTLLDTATSQSVDWRNRELKNVVGTVILDWRTAQFTGTASFATQALSASFATQALSASFATQALSASYVRAAGAQGNIQFNNGGTFGYHPGTALLYDTASRALQNGDGAVATGNYSHAQGKATIASGSYSHAEGVSSNAFGYSSHAEGNGGYTYGANSHTEGSNTTTGNASGYYATMTASGVFTISSSYGDLSGAGLFDAGNLIGVDDSQYDVNYTYINLTAASCSFNGTNTLVHVTDTSFLTSTASIGGITNPGTNAGDQVWGGYAAHAQGNSSTAQGSYSHTEGDSCNAYGVSSHAEGGSNAYGAASHAEGGGQAYGAYSHAEGGGQAYGAYSHAEGDGAAGYNAYRMNAHITGGFIKLEPIYGNQTAQFGAGGFAVVFDNIGDLDPINNTGNTYLFEVSSSAFTSSLTQITLVDNTVTTFTNLGKVQIGVYGTPNPTAADQPLGSYSHAEGVGSKTIGEYSHAAGNTTEALGWYQSVVGMGNKPISDRGAFIVGDGDPDNSIQHNLLVAASGSVTISGSLQVSGSLTISPTSSGTPAYTGKDGEIVFGQTGGNYKIYVWLGGAWRSGSLS